jgi:hypothetical protein
MHSIATLQASTKRKGKLSSGLKLHRRSNQGGSSKDKGGRVRKARSRQPENTSSGHHSSTADNTNFEIHLMQRGSVTSAAHYLQEGGDVGGEAMVDLGRRSLEAADIDAIHLPHELDAGGSVLNANYYPRNDQIEITAV